MNICLIVFLVAALTIVVGNRRITIRQFEWWAVNAIALCMFLTGKYL